MQAVGPVLFLFIAGHTDIDPSKKDTAPHPRVPAQQQIIHDRSIGELPQVLKGAGNTGTGYLVGLQAQQIAPIEGYLTGNGLIDTREYIE